MHEGKTLAGSESVSRHLACYCVEITSSRCSIRSFGRCDAEVRFTSVGSWNFPQDVVRTFGHGIKSLQDPARLCRHQAPLIH